MRQRSLPQLNTSVSELALGTWGLTGEAYGPIQSSDADAIIDRALQLGINLFETSDSYEHGGTLARLASRLPNSARVAVRIGFDRSHSPTKNFSPEYLRTAIARALDLLKRTSIDIALLHNPSPNVVSRTEAPGILDELRANHTIGAWGVSAGSPNVTTAAIESGSQVLSVAYNLFHTHELHAVAAQVALRGIPVLAHSVLAYGLLAAHWGPNRTFAIDDHRRFRWNPTTLRARFSQLSLVRNLVGGDVLTPRAAALRFVLSNSLVTSAVIGPRSITQLDQLVREVGNGPPYLPSNVMQGISSKLRDAGICP